MRNFLLTIFSFSLLGCSNNGTTNREKRITITKYEILKDSSEILSILNKSQQNKKSKIDYRNVIGKIFVIKFLNNSNENIYLLKPLLAEASDRMFENFTASIHLIQVSNDSLKWENAFYRQPVDTYNAEYDTIKPKSTIVKFAYIDNNQKSKYLKLLLKYQTDSAYFDDTIPIVTHN